MNKLLRYKKLAALCGLFVIAASLVGCSSKKYEPITLEAQNESQDETETLTAEESNGQAAAARLAPQEEEQSSPIVLEDAAAADGEAVAGTSPLENELTTASGFIDRDEMVYITEDLVNLRSSWNTESTIITQLNRGDSVKRTGYSDGWSRVLYKEKVCYVLSEFLSIEDPEGADGANVVAQAHQILDMAPVSAANNGRIIAVDAGHQAKGNSEKEPVGPGSSTMKAKVAAGAEGISTKLPEYQLTLDVSKRLKRILEERGYQVVMIRESNDVNISNAERAEIANKSGASILVRIHANSLDNSSVSGVLSMCQTAKNPYNGELHSSSYSLSKKITDSISAQTGFKNRGVQETDTMSGINWSAIPVSIVEMGFMSNPEEDQKMAQEEYQERIAAGIANGIDAYFGG